MASIKKLLRKASEIELEPQSSYKLGANKLYYLTQAAVSGALVGILGYNMYAGLFQTPGSYIYYYYAIIAGAAIYCLLSIVGAFTAKVTIDDEGISIPGVLPFSAHKLQWDTVDRAELTSVITYRSYLSLIIKKMLSFIFANIELRVSFTHTPTAEGANYPVLDRVSDRAMALRIIQEKLGKRFTLYQGEY